MILSVLAAQLCMAGNSTRAVQKPLPQIIICQEKKNIPGQKESLPGMNI